MLNFTAVATFILFLYAVLGYKKPGVALVTVPFAAFALGYAALLTQTEEKVLYAPTLFIVTLIVVAVSTRGRESHMRYHQLASWALLAIILVFLLSGALAIFALAGAGPVVPLLFFFGIAVVVGGLIAHAVVSRRVAEAHVFSILGSSMRQNLPLPMALDCAATGRSDATGQILRRIKTWLVKGYSVTEAVRRGYPQCRSWALAMLVVGERLNQVPAAVKAVRAEIKSRTSERHRLRPVHPFYPVVVLSIMVVLALGLVTFVLPQFKMTLEEVVGGSELLPRSTRALMRVTSVFAESISVAVLLGVAVFIWLAICLRRVWRGRRSERPTILSGAGDFLRWHLPIFHWFERNRSTLQVVELMRMSFNAGTPVNEAIRGALGLDINVCFKRRLRKWLQRVERGEDIAAAARAAGVGRALAWAFDNSDHAGDAPALLEMLESYYRSNYSYRVNLTRFILWPCGIILLGLTVGFVVYATYAPMVVFLGYFAEQIYP